jgi:polar amino acid transport system substrate-binding protein
MQTVFNLFLGFFLGLFTAGFGMEPPFRVGMELGYPPFEMRDELGEPTGVSVDLARALGESLGREVKIENLPFDGLIPALKTGKIDLILSSMTATEERARVIDFSEPYLQTGLCLLVGAKSEIHDIASADRVGRRIVVKKGTTGHLFAMRNLRAAKPLVLDKEAACVLEVAQGKADAFIYDQMSVFSHWQRHPQTTRAVLTPFQQESWAVGFPKGADELRGKVNAFLKNYRETGGFERLGDKWLSPQKTEFKKLGVPFFF